ncbi:hypothetical protein Tco_1560214 [Tanacetum coccineum]
MLPAFVAWLPRLSLSSSVIPIKNVDWYMFHGDVRSSGSRALCGRVQAMLPADRLMSGLMCSISASTHFGSGCLVMFVTSGSASVCCMFSAAESVYVFLLLFVYLCSDLSAECVSASALRLPLF